MAGVKLQWVRLFASKRLHKPHPHRPWLAADYKPCEQAKAQKFMNEFGDIYPINWIIETIYG